MKTRKFAILFVLVTLLMVAFVAPVAAQSPGTVVLAGDPSGWDWLLQAGKDFVSSFFTLLTAALVPALVTALVAWIVRKFQEIKLARPDITRALAIMMPIFVQAAEQAKLAALTDNKKDYAIGLAQTWLTEKGWKLDLTLISGIVEQAVNEAAFPSTTTVTTKTTNVKTPKANIDPTAG